jgi:hypothetical protein
VAHLLKIDGYVLGSEAKKRFLVIGHGKEALRVADLLRSTAIKHEFVGLVETDSDQKLPASFIGHIHQVPEMIAIYHINEVIFCSKDLPHQTIIDKMVAWHTAGVDYKIAPEDSLSIIGSNSINTRGDLYTIGINAIDSRSNRRSKRFFDLVAAMAGLVLWPLLLWFVKKPFNFLKNIFLVFIGRKTWVGYCQAAIQGQKLPAIRKGVLCPASVFKRVVSDDQMINQLNLLYARDYNVWKDVSIFFKAFKWLGN